MNLDEILLLPDLSLSQSVEQLEQAKTKVMEDFNHIVDDCLAFTNDELDLYLTRILKNVEKLKIFTPIQLDESDYSMNISYQPILISQWMDPWTIHFSQSSVHGQTCLDYRIRMMTGM